jgi:hypothetical protein
VSACPISSRHIAGRRRRNQGLFDLRQDHRGTPGGEVRNVVTSSKSTTTPSIWTAVRKIPPIRRKRRAYSPSCAPTSTDPNHRKEASDGQSATQLSRIHGREARRTRRLFGSPSARHSCTRMATAIISSFKHCRSTARSCSGYPKRTRATSRRKTRT